MSMPEYIYYAAEWIVNDAEMRDIDPLYDAAVYLHCLLWDEETVTETGFTAIIFTIQVTSEFQFQAFMALAGHLIPSVKWKPESDPKWILPEGAQPFRFSHLPHNVRRSIFRNFTEAANHNKQLLERQKAKGDAAKPDTM